MATPQPSGQLSATTRFAGRVPDIRTLSPHLIDTVVSVEDVALNVSFRDDPDIVRLSLRILESLRSRVRDTGCIEREIGNLRSTRCGSPSEFSRNRERILKLEHRISSSDDVVKRYLDAVRAWIVRYDTCDDRRASVLGFLRVAGQFVRLEAIRTPPPTALCPECRLSFDDLACERADIKTCPNCGIEQDVSEGSCLESCHVGGSNEDYHRLWESFLAYQGRQQEQPPNTVYSTLDQHFSRRGLPTGEEVRRSRDTSRTSRVLLTTAMTELKLEHYLRDQNLILNLYWFYPLPQVDHLAASFRARCLELQKQARNGLSHLGSQYLLCQILRSLGHNCSRDEFRIEAATITRQNHACRELFESASVTFTPL